MNGNSESIPQGQEKSNITSQHSHQPRKKLCILTKILCGCILGLVAVYILAIFFYEIFDFENDKLSEMIVIFLSVILFSSPFLAIGSLIRINLNPERLRGRVICSLLLAFSCFLVFQASYMMVPAARWHGIARRVVCGTNLKGLGVALEVYAYDYDGVLPSDNWCDRLIEEADISPKSLQCPHSESVEGESDYCLNKYAAGKHLSELPKDMVLLFESAFIPAQNQTREPIQNRNGFSDLKIMSDIFYRGDEEVYLDRWNQVGGPELLTYDRHEDGCNILFADGHTKFIKLPDLTNLRWDVEKDVSFDSSQSDKSKLVVKKPAFFSKKVVLLTMLAGACILATLYILVRFKTIKFMPFVLGIAILSTGTGLLFGNMSEEAYLSESFTGLYSGGIFGSLVGICFAVLLANTPDRIKHLNTFKGFSTSVGMVTGIICSTLVHLALVIVNEETNFAGILIGIPYGVFAGAVLGFFSGTLVKKLYSPQLPVPTEAGDV